MILTSRAVELVADRIARAYARCHAEGTGYSGDTRVWSVAARALLEEHGRNPWLPVDPELFVASQVYRSATMDPWFDLAPIRSLDRYRRRIQQLIKGLRNEVRDEVRRAEKRIRQGRQIDALLQGRCRWLSPLGRYVVAVRAGRSELAEECRGQARDQHDSCPLYRQACRGLIPDHAYPIMDLIPAINYTPRIGPLSRSFCLN